MCAEVLKVSWQFEIVYLYPQFKPFSFLLQLKGKFTNCYTKVASLMRWLFTHNTIGYILKKGSEFKPERHIMLQGDIDYSKKQHLVNLSVVSDYQATLYRPFCTACRI